MSSTRQLRSKKPIVGDDEPEWSQVVLPDVSTLPLFKSRSIPLHLDSKIVTYQDIGEPHKYWEHPRTTANAPSTAILREGNTFCMAAFQ